MKHTLFEQIERTINLIPPLRINVLRHFRKSRLSIPPTLCLAAAFLCFTPQRR
jgi:hypothetical protein